MIENIPLPKLLNDNGAVEKVIHPVSVSINLNIVPLSDATMTLPQGESLPPRSYVQLFTCMGFAGVFRVRSPQDAYGTAYTTAELEHAITEVGDYLVLAEYNEMMAANTAMTTIFSHYRGTKWQLGSVSALGSGQVAVKTNHERVLEAMLGILEQKPDCMMAFDFSTTPWTVNIVAKDTTVTAEGRLARNVNYARVVYDDTELCTRAYYEKLTEGQSTEPSESAWAYVDADTMSTYGLIEKEVKTGSGYTEDEALYIVNEYLRVHKQPRVSVEISAEELSSITGESLDSFAIGKLFRLVLVDYNHLPIEKTITGLSFSNVYETPRAITVMLDQEEDTLINFIHDLDSKGGSGGGGGSGRKQDDELKKFYAEFVNTNKMVGMVVGTFDGEYKVQAGQIILAINESGEPGSYESAAYVNADHVNISATNTAHLLAGSIVYDENGRLVLKESSGGGIYVERTEQGTTSSFGIWDKGNLTGGIMVQQINGQTGTKLTLGADVIDINGLVTALLAYDVTVNTLSTVGTATFEGDVYAPGLTITDGGDINGFTNITGANASFDTLTVDENSTVDCGDIDCNDIDCGDINADGIVCLALNVGGSDAAYAATWQTETIPTLTFSNRYNFVYKSNGVEYTSLGYIVGSHGSKTIHYLGGATT